MRAALEVKGLTARFGDLEILRGVDLEVPFGEIHVLMGPNGSGKSTLSHALMGSDEYAVTGSATVGGVEIMSLDVDARARAGLFQAFQYPVEIPGVSLGELVAAMGEASGDPHDFAERVEAATDALDMRRFVDRAVNVGLSGGEKKRSEMYQMVAAGARVAVLDEIDSGLDIDAVREIAGIVESLRGPDLGVLLITHYSRILRYMSPDRVHVMVGGTIVESGGPEIATRLEQEGYGGLEPA